MNEMIPLKDFLNNSGEDIAVTFSLKKVNSLINEGLIRQYTINEEVHINIDDLLVLQQIESELNENHVSLNFFLTDIIQSKSPALHSKKYREVLSAINKRHRIRCTKYRSNQYINKNDADSFSRKFISKERVISQLSLNTYLYEEILSKNDIYELKVSPKYKFISRKDFQLFHRKANDYSIDDKTTNWVKGTQITIDDNLTDIIPKKTETLYRFCKQHSIAHYKDSSNILYVDYTSIRSFSQKVEKIRSEYYPILEVTEMMGIIASRTNLEKKFIPNLINMCEKFDINVLTIAVPLFHETIFLSKHGMNRFLKHYISNRDIVHQYNLTSKNLLYITSLYEIPYFELNTRFRYYQKDVIDRFLQKDETLLYLGDTDKYYSLAQTKRLLHVNDSQLKSIRREDNIDYFTCHGTTYYKKDQVNQLLARKEYIRENYVPYVYITKHLPLHCTKYFQHKIHPKGIERYVFMDDVKQKTVLLYSKGEYNTFIQRKKYETFVSQVSYDNPVDSFFELLTIFDYTFSKNSIVTRNSWHEFCVDKLLYNQIQEDKIPYLVNELVKCTKYVCDLSVDRELHNKSTTEINFYLFSDQIPFSHKAHLFRFMKKMHYTLRRKNILTNFKLHSLTSPYKDRPNASPQKIYDYDLFKNLYDFVNTKNHKGKAIQDGVTKITNMRAKLKDDSESIAYSWLYTLLHLNNAWRHNDICRIKMINIDFLNIDSLEAFKNRILTDQEVNKITNLILVNEYTVSKTQVSNNLFISNDIKQTFAYAYVICHLINIRCYPTSDNLIHFNNKQNLFTKPLQNAFFKEFKTDFTFQNRKMNRTLLTIMFNLLKTNNDNGSALEIAKRLRAHQDEETTNIYIQIPEEDMNELTLHLFNRGIFGFIPSILNEIINGRTNDLTTDTNNIVNLNAMFKNVYNIEASSGFLNNMMTQKEHLMDYFIKHGINHALDLMNQLQKNALPSKDLHFQCLWAKTGCIQHESECKHCAYSIPNFYAISNIITSVTDSLKNFKHKFESTPYEAEKTKIANLLFMELDILNDAFNTFGQDDVLQFFKNSKEGYFELLELMDNVDSQKPLLNYLTYSVKGTD